MSRPQFSSSLGAFLALTGMASLSAPERAEPAGRRRKRLDYLRFPWRPGQDSNLRPAA